MAITTQVRKTILELDNDRKEIMNKSKQVVPWLIAFPALVILCSIFFLANPIAIIFSILISLVASGIIYSTSIQSPFKKLHQTLRAVLLDELLHL